MSPDTALQIGGLHQGEEAALIELVRGCGLTDAGLAGHLENAVVARESSARLVGSAVLEISRDGALLRSVAVEKSRRGAGLGVRLVESALELARLRGARRVFLLTETAGDFFPRFGFRRISRADVPESVRDSVEFRSACPESALVMERAV